MTLKERHLQALLDEVEEVFREKKGLYEFTTVSFRQVLAARDIHREITAKRLTIGEFYRHISNERAVPDASEYITENWRSVIPHFVDMLPEEQLPDLVEVIMDDPVIQAVAEIRSCEIRQPPIVVWTHGRICNADAVFTLAELYEELVTAYNLSVICVEGAEGVVDTSWFRAFPDQEIRKEVAQYFVRKGEITAPEYTSITADKFANIYGMEQKEYYVKLHGYETGTLDSDGLQGERIFDICDRRRRQMLENINVAIAQFRPTVMAVESTSVGMYRGPDLLRDSGWTVIEMEPRAKGGINWELYRKVIRGEKDSLETLLTTAS